MKVEIQFKKGPALTYIYKSTREIQSAFRKEYKNTLDFKIIPDYSGKGRMYKTDTRVAFCDWLYDLYKCGLISERLAQTAYLSPR